jgi:ABC-type dipeptide/oligopeptide/nickel transport system permease subunit
MINYRLEENNFINDKSRGIFVMNLKKMRNWRVFNSLKAVVGMLIITIVILIAFFPDHLSPFDPYGISPLERLQNPNAKYLFGTDD